MSNCLIRIKIGDQEIVLDPGADISVDGIVPLGNVVPVDQLRNIYNQLKDNLSNGVLRTFDEALVREGAMIYQAVLDEATVNNEFKTLLGTIRKEKNEYKLKALTAYATSLDSKEVLAHGNFAIDPRDAHKMSPYSMANIRELIFIKEGDKVKLFDELTSLPGMETLKVSIAYAETWNGQPLERVEGAYITPDNIIQLVIPYKKAGYHLITDRIKVSSDNIDRLAKSEAQNVLIHELMHAVYSELYKSDPDFKAKLDEIHQTFLKALEAQGEAKKPIIEQYKSVQEFIARGFEDNRLQGEMSAIQSPNDVDLTLTMFDSFTAALDSKLTEKQSILKDYISLIGHKLPNIGITTVTDLKELSKLNASDFDNIFFSEGQDEIASEEDAFAPRDQNDNKYSINRKAFYVSKRFQEKYKENGLKRDAYYHATVQKTTEVQLDTLFRDDVVILPWLEYVKVVKDKKGKTIKPGYYQEVGLVVSKDDDDKAILNEKGKNRIEPIIRNEKGEVLLTADGHKVKEMSQSLPLIYSNAKKQVVVIAKTNLTDRDENSKEKFNSSSYPYSLVKGFRRLDRQYFDHNEDYEAQLKETQAKLARAINSQDSDKKFEDMAFFNKRVEQLEANIIRAAQIKEEIAETYKLGAFSYKDGDTTMMNVHEGDYKASNYTQEGKRIFNEEPVFRLFKFKNKTKAGKDGYYVTPSVKMFKVFWDSDGTGKEYAKTSEEMSQAVSKGDMLRVSMKQEYEVGGEKVKVPQGEWRTVYKKVANGIIVATPDGKGYLVPFNMILGYAKNKTTADFKALSAFYSLQVAGFMNSVTETKTSAKGTKYKGFNTERVSFKGMNFDAKYHKKEDETEEEAVLRFDKDIERTKSRIKPNQSFVKIAKRFKDKEGKIVDYQANGIVLAKTSAGLIVLTDTNGFVDIITIKYTDKINKGDTEGMQLMFVMENLTKVNQLWEEYNTERTEIAKNKTVANFEKLNGKWVLKNNPKDNPHHIKDVYDFYDKVTGVVLSRLTEGSLVSVKMNKDKMDKKEAESSADYYYRKVVRVMDDGTVVVADFNKERKNKGGFTFKPGKAYARYINPANILSVGLKLGKVTKDDDGELKSEYNSELLERRKKLWERSKMDRDFNNLVIAKDLAAVTRVNAQPKKKGWDYWRYVPLTNKLLDPKSEDKETYYLDKDFNKVESIEKAAYAMAIYEADTDNLKRLRRGIMTETTMFYSSIITYKDAKGYTKFRKEFTKDLMAGDWVTTKSATGAYWDAVIERVEGDDIYVLNMDMTTSRVSPSKITGVRLSARNDRYSGYTRSKRLMALLNVKKTKTDAETLSTTVTGKKRDRSLETDAPTDEEEPFSLEADYKSPRSSRRALHEVGNRLKELNPEIKINYVEQPELTILAKETGHDYSKARAFVYKAEVFINVDRASISDVVHEYAHLFLHTLKYDNTEMYNAIIAVTNNHSMYNQIAADYGHLDKQDLDEEVFVTVLGEYMGGQLRAVDQENMAQNEELLLGFASYTKAKLSKAFNKTIDTIYDIDPKEMLNLTIEDVINLVGDRIMKTRITDVHARYAMEGGTSDINKLKEDLISRGLVTQECYG